MIIDIPAQSYEAIDAPLTLGEVVTLLDEYGDVEVITQVNEDDYLQAVENGPLDLERRLNAAAFGDLTSTGLTHQILAVVPDSDDMLILISGNLRDALYFDELTPEMAVAANKKLAPEYQIRTDR